MAFIVEIATKAGPVCESYATYEEAKRRVDQFPADSLAGQGVPNALPDTLLELHDGNGGTLMTNDNWKDTQQTEITATGVPPTDDRESAMVPTLAPGNYTAVVRGKNSTTGVGLVEVYNLQ